MATARAQARLVAFATPPALELKSIQQALNNIRESLQRMDAAISPLQAIQGQQTQKAAYGINNASVMQKDLDDLTAVVAALGEAGETGTVLTLQAGAAVGGHRVLALVQSSLVRHADITAAADAGLVIGLSLNAANAGGDVTIALSGQVVTESSWAWAASGEVYATGAGQLTQTVPSAPDVFMLPVGVASSPTSLLVQIGIPIHFA